MPYIRLYSRKVSLAEKRMLAEKLMSITLSALQLSAEERHQITIQFMPPKFTPRPVDSSFRVQEASAVLEVSDHDLTVRKINDFVEAATPVLSESRAVRRSGRIARMLGVAPDPSRQIAFQFNELRPRGKDASGDSFPPVALPRAA